MIHFLNIQSQEKRRCESSYGSSTITDCCYIKNEYYVGRKGLESPSLYNYAQAEFPHL